MTESKTPIKARRRTPAARACRALALVTAAAVAVTGLGPVGPLATPVYAQERVTTGLPIIRDTEIENLLRDYARPILRVAGLGNHHIKVVIINSRVFNAFVMDGRHIFVNAGALFQTKTPNELIGIFAHETGHLADGHLMRRREKIAQAQTMSIVAMLAGIGAAVAGASMGGASGTNLGAAAIMAPQATIGNLLLAYSRAQEDQADHAAVRFLTATHQSAKGLLDLFERLHNEMLFDHDVDPYLQNHPLPAARVASLQRMAKASPYWNKKDPPALQLRHDMMRAKLSGFLESPSTVLRRYPLSNRSLPARYARAISAYRHSRLSRSIGLIDGLIRSKPDDPYFYELKGQALLEGGRPLQAIAPLRRAVALSRYAPLIEILLGQAMVATNQKRYAGEAARLLQSALRQEPNMASAYEQLAMAYGREGKLARADLASAHAAFNRGDIKTARMLAARAKTRLKVGSPAWVRADDIVNASASKNH
ncbi:MAG: M48 family metalloprotease [Pseudolabrys sp.]